MKFVIFTFSLILFTMTSFAQSGQLPFYQIPDYPAGYTPETVAARMIDGLGFRYHWATDGLRPEDLAFQPTPEARATEETIDHILSMSNGIANTLRTEPRGLTRDELAQMSFADKRKRTLENLKEASDLLKSGAKTLQQSTIKMGASEFPFWNLINGQIADCLWHTGQIVSFRRMSGNPINPKVNVFLGKVME